jgi:hypothetical protein
VAEQDSRCRERRRQPKCAPDHRSNHLNSFRIFERRNNAETLFITTSSKDFRRARHNSIVGRRIHASHDADQIARFFFQVQAPLAPQRVATDRALANRRIEVARAAFALK